MELRVLKYFLIVAREGNITKAAELLHVSQPAISRQLAQLEEELGIKAFTRSNHHIVLTEEGMLLRRRAQEIVDLAEKTRLDFQKETEELTGEIAIGSGELRGFSNLAVLLTDFHALHPQVRYALFSGNADNIKERIENGTLDIGLLSLPVDLSRYDFIRLSVHEEFGMLVREDSPLAQKAHIEPEDLLGIPLMVPERALVRREIDNWLGLQKESLNVVLTYNLLYNVTTLVRSGLGAAVCLRMDCLYDGLVFVPIAASGMENGSVLVYKKHQAQSPAVGALLAYIQEKLD